MLKAAGITGGRTGLTSLVTAGCFLLSIYSSLFAGAVPSAATAPVLVLVGCMMLSSFKEIKWDDLSEAIPAFFAGIFMALCYSISYGIAAGFIFYCIVKIVKKEAKGYPSDSLGYRLIHIEFYNTCNIIIVSAIIYL